MIEEWRDIVGYWPYQVSNQGRIRVAPDSPRRRGLGQAGHIMALNSVTRSGRGYVRFDLYREARRFTFKLHKVVAAAFLGPCPEGHQVNHKSGIKTDNRAENLEYVTGLDNVRHAIALGLYPRARADKLAN